ncbi:MAG: hypothetical protein K2Y40_12675 [Reyranella sp.]|jgi:hypothetical protein|nr:hypothetical protein [Reyranella sp.]
MTTISEAIPTTMPPPPAGEPHGKRATATIIMRMRILLRCRTLMIQGIYKPTIEQIAGDRITKKAVRYHFPEVRDLHREAIDPPTRTGILRHLMPNGPWPSADDCDRIIAALVFREPLQ